MSRQEEIVYEARIVLFGVIPLWRVKHTKREWQRLITLQFKKNKTIQLEFIDSKK